MRKFSLVILVLLFVSMIACFSLAQSVEVVLFFPLRMSQDGFKTKLVSMMP
jgi:hypothetical protein